MGRTPEAEASAVRGGFARGKRTRADWLSLGVVASLSLTLVVQAARTGVELWRLGRMPAPAHIPAARQLERSDPRLALAALLNAHLFGKAPEAPAEAPQEAAAQWVVTGTLQGKTPGSGAAILGRSTTTTRFCSTGQEVAGGFRLVEVFPDRVTLERAGERVSLRLPRSLPSSPSGHSLRLAAAVAPEPEPAPEPAATDVRAANRPEAAVQLDPSEHKRHGHYDGMRVWGTGNGSNLAPYGLRRDDIIRAVDGKLINNSEAQLQALRALSQGHPVPVTIERNGTVFNLQLGFTEPED